MIRAKLDSKPKGNGRLGLLVLVSIILLLVNIFISSIFGIASLSTSQSNFVQLSNGSTVEVEAVSATERSPEVIRSFVEQIYTGLHTWDGYLALDSTGERQPDPGVEIEGTEDNNRRGRISTNSFESSYGLSLELRKQMLPVLAGITPQSVFEQKKAVLFVPTYIGEPIAIPDKPGHWSVNLVSSLVALEDGQQLGNVIPLNKKLYVRSVTRPKYPAEFSNPVAEIIAEVRKAGLEIYSVHDLTITELEKSLN